MKAIDTVNPVTDPVIAEVRRHKQEVAEVFNFDVLALGRSLQQREIRGQRFVALRKNMEYESSLSECCGSRT